MLYETPISTPKYLWVKLWINITQTLQFFPRCPHNYSHRRRRKTNWYNHHVWTVVSLAPWRDTPSLTQMHTSPTPVHNHITMITSYNILTRSASPTTTVQSPEDAHLRSAVQCIRSSTFVFSVAVYSYRCSTWLKQQVGHKYGLWGWFFVCITLQWWYVPTYHNVHTSLSTALYLTTVLVPVV